MSQYKRRGIAPSLFSSPTVVKSNGANGAIGAKGAN
jgi:hypothetical protein